MTQVEGRFRGAAKAITTEQSENENVTDVSLELSPIEHVRIFLHGSAPLIGENRSEKLKSKASLDS